MNNNEQLLPDAVVNTKAEEAADIYISNLPEKNQSGIRREGFIDGYNTASRSGIKADSEAHALHIILTNCMRYPDTIGAPTVKFLLSRGIGKDATLSRIKELEEWLERLVKACEDPHGNCKEFRADIISTAQHIRNHYTKSALSADKEAGKE